MNVVLKNEAASALPDELRLTASFLTEQGFTITVTQSFTQE